MSAAEVAYNGTAASTREASAYEIFNLPSPQSYLVTGTNLIAIQAANIQPEQQFGFLLRRATRHRSGQRHHWADARRSQRRFATNAPPQIRQVDHSPERTCQQPGRHHHRQNYRPRKASAASRCNIKSSRRAITSSSPTPPIPTRNWITLAMNDAGNNGDALAGDSIYTAVIPASVQQHRRLIRYRITATDGAGSSITVPYADDPQPNFAYFCLRRRAGLDGRGAPRRDAGRSTSTPT